MSKEKYKKSKLPDKFIILACPDKANQEHWCNGRSLASFPCPSRILLAGRPDSGKSTVIKNILLHASPLYDRLIIVCCTKETNDYDLLEPHLVLDRLPTIESFDRKLKNCLIIDDYKPKTTADKALLDRFFGYVSTHCNTTIMYATQDIFSLFSPVIRRMSNVFILWRNFDKSQLKMIATRIGMPYESIVQLMDDLDFGDKDSLTIDLTHNTPSKLRKNLFLPIIELEVPDIN